MMQALVVFFSRVIDAVLALFWTDLAASRRWRTWLQARYVARGQTRETAYRLASRRLLAAVGMASVFAPWLALGLAYASREDILPGAPLGLRNALLFLGWMLTWAYGRGVLQWLRADAWRRSIYRLCAHDPLGSGEDRLHGVASPQAAGGAVLRRWKAARLWAWATGLTLLALVLLIAEGPALPALGAVVLLLGSLGPLTWMADRHNRMMGEVFRLGMDGDADEVMGRGA